MTDTMLEPLGATMASLVEELAVIPCPTEGCPGEGRTMRYAATVVDVPCADCQAVAEAARKAADRQEQVEGLLAVAGGTARLEGFTLGSYPDDAAGRAAKMAALRWHDLILASREEGGKPAPNLLLYGPVGGGKTGLLWPIIVSLCEHLVHAKMVDFPTLLETMRDHVGRKEPFDSSALVKLPVLVLDDLGAERPTDFARGQLLQLVNARYERCLPTAYISNYDPDALAERLGSGEPIIGERIVSRMMEGALQHRLRSDDRRLS